MKTTYPLIIAEAKDTTDITYLVYAPDFDRMTQGETLVDALEMGADLIETLGVDAQDSGQQLPAPTALQNIDVASWITANNDDGTIKGAFATLVAVDFERYRKKTRNTSVRRNVSLPAWLDDEATRAGINVSAVLKEALRRELQAM
jgi:predicted RNase H-like HicB family nuclease